MPRNSKPLSRREQQVMNMMINRKERLEAKQAAHTTNAQNPALTAQEARDLEKLKASILKQSGRLYGRTEAAQPESTATTIAKWGVGIGLTASVYSLGAHQSDIHLDKATDWIGDKIASDPTGFMLFLAIMAIIALGYALYSEKKNPTEKDYTKNEVENRMFDNNGDIVIAGYEAVMPAAAAAP
jgi:hypothetical protein